jgi:hypothetical protein
LKERGIERRRVRLLSLELKAYGGRRTPIEIIAIIESGIRKLVLRDLEREFGALEEESFSNDDIDPWFYNK